MEPNAAAARAERLIVLGLPVMVLGQPGTGKLRFVQGMLGAQTRTLIRLDGSALTAAGDAANAVSRWITQTQTKMAEGTRPGIIIDRLDVLGGKAQRRLLAWLSALDRRGVLRGPRAAAHLIATSDGDAVPDGFARVFASQEVRLPSLAQRADLANVIRQSYSQKTGTGAGLADDALTLLTRYAWPGNLPELEAVLSQIALNEATSDLTVAMLPNHIRAATQTAQPLPPGLDEALSATGWNVSRAARLMGISRATINRRIKEAGLTRPPQTLVRTG